MILKYIPLILAAVTASGGQSDIKVFRLAKAEPHPVAQPSASALPAGHPDISAANSKLMWTVPHGWEESPPGDMRVGSFRVKGSDGKQADISIIPLGGHA